MIQVAPQMRILVAVEAIDFRNGIDGLARVCKQQLQTDPFSGGLFVFRNRRRTAIKILVYDGHGFWLCQKRLSAGRFRFWPACATELTHGPSGTPVTSVAHGRRSDLRQGSAGLASAADAGVNNNKVPPVTERACVPAEIRLRCRCGSKAALPAPGNHRQRRSLHSPAPS
jgi:IS66 Orf2 like protein